MIKENKHGKCFYNLSTIFDEEDGSTVLSDNEITIEYIEINKEDRRQGHGRKLLAETINAIKKIGGVDTIVLSVVEKDDVAVPDLIDFYESFGFGVTGENCQAIIMELRI